MKITLFLIVDKLRVSFNKQRITTEYIQEQSSGVGGFQQLIRTREYTATQR